MARQRVSSFLVQSKLRSTVLSVSRPYSRRCIVRRAPSRWISAVLSHTDSGDHATLRELVSQGRYCEALDHWEEAKETGGAGPGLYSSVMLMAARVGGVKAAQYVKEDMERQGWDMDHGCSLHYLCCLVDEGHVCDAVKFIKSSNLRNNQSFLLDCASVLLDREYPQTSLEVCDLAPPLSPPLTNLQLLTVQLEALGTLGRDSEMEQLVGSLCSGEGGLPRGVELALANGYSLAGQPLRAFSHLKSNRSYRSVPVKSLALLLESALREENCTLAAEACSLFWNQSTIQPSDEAILFSPSSLSHHTTYHCRAITTALSLQAYTHRNTADTCVNGSSHLASFLKRNFFQELQQNKYPCNLDMYQALLLLSCYHSPALSWADSVMKQYTALGQTVSASSLTTWARACGTIIPQQALRVIHLVRAHRHHYQLNFDLCHYGDLLSIQYTCDSLTRQKEALDCIRAIKNSMDKWGLLNTAEGYNLVLEAVVRVPAVGAHYTTYNDMVTSYVDTNLHTFHILLDGTLAEGSVKNTRKAAYHLWRSLMKEWPRIRPDVKLVNKFIRCSLICSDVERGLVFLSALSDCSIDPDTHTFTLLLKLCHSANDRQNFEKVLKLAQHCLPDQHTEISATARELQIQWRAEEDFDLAQSILSQLETSRP